MPQLDRRKDATKPMQKPILIIAFSTVVTCAAYGQSQAKTDSSTALKATQSAADSTQNQEEVVDGIWAVSSYLGKKLANEVSNRMNLDESSEPVARKPKKVIFKIAGIKIEHTD